MKTLKRLRKNNRGNLYVWVIALTMIMAVMFIWVSFYDIVHNSLVPILNGFSGNPANSTTWNTLTTIFDAFPIIVVGGIILWAYVAAQREEPGAGWL